MHDLLDYKASSVMFKNYCGGIWGKFSLIQSKWEHVPNLVKQGLSNLLGDGRVLSFLEDVWLRSNTLKVTYPRF